MSLDLQIIFDAERMRYPNTGLFHYCLHLGDKLVNIAHEEAHNAMLKIYCSKDSQVFDNHASYLRFCPLQKFIFPSLAAGTIWHSNFQLTNYMPTSRKIKKVITVHDLNFLREKEAHVQSKYLDKLQRNVYRCDVIVCISEFVKKELLSHCDVKSKRIEVIYNGNNIKSNISAVPLQREGLDLTKPFLFSVGVIVPKKNFLVLVYLLVHNDFNLVLSGLLDDKNYQNEIISLATKLGVQDRVFLTGIITEGEKYYLLKNCHTFCFPSITEGFGLPVVEAMHFGCDILLSTHTCLPEIGGDVVRYFDSFEATYLQELGKEMPSWQHSTVQKGKVKERSKLFSWSTAARAYWNIYTSL